MKELNVIKELVGASFKKGVIESYEVAKLVVESVGKIEKDLETCSNLMQQMRSAVVDPDKPETPSEKG